MTPEDKALFLNLPEDKVMALTIYGEAEGEKLRGKFAVGFVIKNRADLWHKSIHDICLQRNQFECFNDGNKRLPILRKLAGAWDDSLTPLKDSLTAATGVLSGNIQSNVGLATFYKTMTCYSPWFEKQIVSGNLIEVCTVGNHDFFEEKRFHKEAL